MKPFALVIVLAALCSITAEASIFGSSSSKPTCGGSSSSKTIGLIVPNNPPRQCKYEIKAYSKYVCQLRIDFAMTLAQPTRPTANNSLKYVQCIDDYFQVGDLKLCGIETSQHIYVPFNRTAGTTSVNLEIVLANRVGLALPKPYWDMHVTQLECPSGGAIRSLDFDYEMRSAPHEDERRKHHHHHRSIEPRASDSDGFLVAPPGCLQYFPQAAGHVNSFNYNNGQGIYPGKLNYAICFRRTQSTSALEIKPLFFQLGAEFGHLNVLHVDNYCYPQVRSTAASEDYLMVPLATIQSNQMHATYFCGDSLKGTTVSSTNPGPLIMVFNSDGAYMNNEEMGFAISYKLL